MPRLPFASIIIPALNEEAFLRECLESALRLDYPKDRYEVIVVDNGSTDATVRIARAFGVTVLERPGLKIGAVRNAGYHASCGEVIAFTDADCVLPESWLATGQAFLLEEGVGAVGGGILVRPDSTWLERCWVVSQAAEVRVVRNLAGSSFMLRREIFERCGRFAENVVAGEDDKLSAELRRNGYSLLSLRGCSVVHLGYPKTFSEVVRRQVWHSKNSCEIRDGSFDKMFIATNLFCLCTLLTPIIALSGGSGALALACLSVAAAVIALQPLRKSIMEYKGNKRVIANLVKFFQLYLVYLFFFVGRSAGLAINYFNIIVGR
jgi:glycosyltransferase involved in cell wall biosynthesis